MNPPATSPQVLKKMEKQNAKAGKADESNVQRALKDLENTEKAKGKAEKAAVKAEQVLDKQEKKELEAIKSVNKAAHIHDLAVTDLKSAEKDVKLKQQQTAKLQQEIGAKKVHVETVIKQQKAHAQEREEKLTEIKSSDSPAGATSSTQNQAEQ